MRKYLKQTVFIINVVHVSTVIQCLLIFLSQCRNLNWKHLLYILIQLQHASDFVAFGICRRKRMTQYQFENGTMQ